MNRLKKGLAFFFGILILGSCFDPPEFPNTPRIEFNRIEFVESASGSEELVIYVDFSDGNGDLGIDPNDDKYRDAPFNDTYFFLENNGKLDTLSTITIGSATEPYDLLIIPDPSKGKLVNFRTSKRAPYNNILPQVYSCIDYELTSDKAGAPGAIGRKLLVLRSAGGVIPRGSKIDSLRDNSNPPNFFYQVKDSLYMIRNPNHSNIEVDFFLKEPNNPLADADGFVEHDWRKYLEGCLNFDGRFPVLTDNENSVEGTLRYAMYTFGMESQLSVKTIKLRIQIKDRALNKSNVIYTPEFTLDKIRKK